MVKVYSNINPRKKILTSLSDAMLFSRNSDFTLVENIPIMKTISNKTKDCIK